MCFHLLYTIFIIYKFWSMITNWKLIIFKKFMDMHELSNPLLDYPLSATASSALYYLSTN